MPKDEKNESTLTVEEFTYLAATDFLYYVLVVFEDEINGQYYSIKYGADYAVFEQQSEWSPLVDAVLKWALDKGLAHQARLKGSAHDYVKSTLSDSTSDFFIIAEQRLMAAAKRPSGRLDWVAVSRVPVSVYLYYCGWLFYVLRTFQEIHDHLTTTAPQLASRFDPVRKEYRRLLEVLQGELPSIETITGVDERTSAQVREAVEAVGKELSEEWRQAVYETAKQIQTQD